VEPIFNITGLLLSDCTVFTQMLIETRDLYGRCPPAVAASPAPTSAYSLPEYLAAKSITVPTRGAINTYRIEGKSDLRRGAREGEKERWGQLACPL
jgi:hypothetical protein